MLNNLSYDLTVRIFSRAISLFKCNGFVRLAARDHYILEYRSGKPTHAATKDRQLKIIPSVLIWMVSLRIILSLGIIPV